MVKRNVKYQGISIPVPIIDKIKNHMKTHTEYTSATNFIREAIKEKLDREIRPDFSFKGYKKICSPEMKRIEILEEKMDKLLKKKN